MAGVAGGQEGRELAGRVSVAAPLLYRGRTRAAWIATAVPTAMLAALSFWGSLAVSGNLTVNVVSFGMALGYGWLADGAVRVAFGRKHDIGVEDEHLVIAHDGLMPEPLVLHRTEIDEVEVDPRPIDERRTAAGLRRGGVSPPTFLAPNLAVISPAVSSHSDDGTAVTPNLVVRFRANRELPAPPLSIRMLLRLAQGRHGAYRGPKPRREYRAVRLVVDGVGAAAEALDEWEPLDVEARDARYLAAVTAEHHRRYRRKRLLMGLGVTGIMAFFVILQLVARS